MIGSAAKLFAQQVDSWTQRLANDQRIDPVESITAEIIPFCAALKRIGRRGHKILADRSLGFWGRPPWLLGVRQIVRRHPHGTVLILGTWNYPLFLVGVQTAQALAAGNRVWIKPAVGCTAITAAMVQTFLDAGVPAAMIRVLGESVEDAVEAIDTPVQLVVLTGSASTARSVLRRCAETLTPVIAEASGCDAMVCLPNPRAEFVANLIRFALTLNSGATCISPRRIYVADHDAEILADQVQQKLSSVEPMVVHPAARQMVIDLMADVQSDRIIAGERLPVEFSIDGRMRPTIVRVDDADDPLAQCDVFAPLAGWHVYDSSDPTQPAADACRYGLAASVIGPRPLAIEFADRLDVGTVVINDVIVPTADPRVAFGGRKQSGFGVTRGDEGLLAMTFPKTTAIRKHGPMTHLRPRSDADQPMLSKLTRWLYR